MPLIPGLPLFSLTIQLRNPFPCPVTFVSGQRLLKQSFIIIYIRIAVYEHTNRYPYAHQYMLAASCGNEQAKSVDKRFGRSARKRLRKSGKRRGLTNVLLHRNVFAGGKAKIYQD